MVVAVFAQRGSKAPESKMLCWRPLTNFGIKSVFPFLLSYPQSLLESIAMISALRLGGEIPYFFLSLGGYTKSQLSPVCNLSVSLLKCITVRAEFRWSVDTELNIHPRARSPLLLYRPATDAWERGMRRNFDPVCNPAQHDQRLSAFQGLTAALQKHKHFFQKKFPAQNRLSNIL